MEVTKFFLSIEKEEKWLNDMSSEGCRFVGKHGFSYMFEPCEKGTYRYCIDQRGFLKNSEEFVGFLDELNMKLVHKQWGFYYFEADRSCSTEKIYTDIKSKSSFYLRCILWLACIGILNISIINHANGPYFLNISIPIVANTVVLCLVLSAILKYVWNILLLHLRK